MSILQDMNIYMLFPELDGHLLDTPVNDNHIINLIKIICSSYCKIRLHHIAKEANNSPTAEIKKSG